MDVKEFSFNRLTIAKIKPHFFRLVEVDFSLAANILARSSVSCKLLSDFQEVTRSKYTGIEYEKHLFPKFSQPGPPQTKSCAGPKD
jgi:hypothetical protein